MTVFLTPCIATKILTSYAEQFYGYYELCIFNILF